MTPAEDIAAKTYGRIVAFVRESNAIEGILRDPTRFEIEATEQFLCLFSTSVAALNRFQAVVAPHKPLRDAIGEDVRVGNYIAPPGGPTIKKKLAAICRLANQGADPWKVHCRFEMLHPYMDGNGRTGRMLWAWQMATLGRDPFGLPFLHRFYYQTLEHSR